jgi:hypothetical protein
VQGDLENGCHDERGCELHLDLVNVEATASRSKFGGRGGWAASG